MKNCHDDMIAFDCERVTLSSDERKEMRERRNSNRDRLDKGLKRDNEPAPSKLQSQGSYAMWTMVQYAEKDYDIDDGVYFSNAALVGPKGGDRTPGAAKEMVRKAVHDENFNEAPKVRTNCVRIYYNAGYHVDLPVYRVITDDSGMHGSTESYELASTEWKTSNPSDVTDWFKAANKSQSPNTDNGGQLRRVTRLLKMFSCSRASWKDLIASGLIITKLVVERYAQNDAREDTSLYDTMAGIRDRLNASLEVDHPVVLSEKLTSGPEDAKTRFLRDKLSDAIDTLDRLFESDCSQADARKAWDKAFNTDFFGGRPSNDDDDDGGDGGKGTSAAILIKGGEDKATRDAVDKQGGGTYG